MIKKQITGDNIINRKGKKRTVEAFFPLFSTIFPYSSLSFKCLPVWKISSGKILETASPFPG